MVPMGSIFLLACRKTRKPLHRDTIHLALNADFMAPFFSQKVFFMPISKLDTITKQHFKVINC